MDLRHLRTFVAIAEQGSVSKAALRLRVAQPALSRQIIDLERNIGFKLFDRAGRRMLLTKEGEQFLGNCRTVLGNVASLTEQAHLLRGGNSGTLKIAASPQIMERVLPSFLPCFAKMFPNVQVKLIEAVGRDQLTMLEHGDADISIGLLGAVQAEQHFASLQLPAVEILAACLRSHPLGARRCGRHHPAHAIPAACPRFYPTPFASRLTPPAALRGSNRILRSRAARRIRCWRWPKPATALPLCKPPFPSIDTS